MKKTLLAAALIAGYAGAASAQNSVTLYGVVDIGFAYQNVKAGTGPNFEQPGKNFNQFTMASGQQNGSRWGLKGVEDLGDGLKANFVYEAGIAANDGTSSGFTRRSTLGLTSTKWGAIDLGRRFTASEWALASLDPFGTGFGQASMDASFGTTSGRLSNAVFYTTPSISGFAAAIAYSFNTGLNGTVNGIDNISTATTYGTGNKFRAVDLGLKYANGPIYLAGNYANYMGAGDTLTQGTTVKAWTIGGSYDLKVVKLSAAYGQNIDGIIEGQNVLSNAGISGGDGNTRGGVLYSQGAKTQQWMVGATAPVGTGSVFASVQQLLPRGSLSGAVVSTQTTASIGYSYPFSKRTNAYAYYSYMNNAALQSGAKSQVLGVGIRHLF